MSTTPNQQVTNGNVLKFIKDYWFIVLIIFSIAMTWANFTGKININTKTNNTQDIDIKDNTASIGNLNLKYTEDITFIKTTLENLINPKK